MKRVLIVLTSHATLGDTGQPTGYYLCEVAQPFFVFEKAGYQVELASIKGGEPSVIETSVNLNDPYNKRFLERANILSALRGTSRLADLRANSYQAVFFAGGHGAMWDYPRDPALIDIAADVYEQGGFVSAVGHGAAALVNIRLEDGLRAVCRRGSVPKEQAMRDPDSGDPLPPPRRPIFQGLFSGVVASILFAASPGSSGPALAQQSARKPNILVIMGDDVGWFNIGAYHRGIMSGKTPNLDKLAAEGMMFTDYYAEASCTAGRANFIIAALAQTAVEYPPMQAPASFNLEAVKAEVQELIKSHEGQ